MLEIKGLSKIYKTKGNVTTTALNNVSIKFPETGMVFLLGKSGSGKSTLLNLCGGLDTPDSGEIIIKGRSSKTFLASDFDSYRNTFIGFVFQEYNILNEFTVEDNIALALELQGKSKDKNKIDEILKQVELESFAKRKPNTLSGGQKQRIAIARALIKDPQIILADEPTGALDSNTGKQVLDTLKSLSKTKLVIVVSHDKEFAEIYGNRIIELKDGEIISDVSKSVGNTQNIGNITIIDDSTILIGNSQELTQDDLKALNTFIKNSKKEILLSSNESDIISFKEQAKINNNGAKETFIKTNESNIKIKEYSENENILIKSKLPIRHAIKIGTSNLKLKPIRLFFTIFLSLFAFIFLGIMSTMMFYNKADVAVNSIFNSDLEYIPLEKGYRVTTKLDDYAYVQNYNTNLNTVDMEKIINNYGKNSIFYYDYRVQGPDGCYDVDLYLDEMMYSNYYSFYSNNIVGFSNIEINHPLLDSYIGYYPNNSNEVMISSYTFESIKKNGYLNKNNNVIFPKTYLEIDELSINGHYFKVCGVYNVDNFIPDKYYKLLNEDIDYSLKSEWNKEIEYGIYTLILVNDSFYEDNKTKFLTDHINQTLNEPIYIDDNIFYSISIKDNYQLYKFNDLDDNNDVYMSSTSIFNSINQYVNNNLMNINNNKINKKIIYPINDNKIYLNKNKVDDFSYLAVKDSFKLIDRNGNFITSSNDDVYASTQLLTSCIKKLLIDNNLEGEFGSIITSDNLSLLDALNIFSYGDNTDEQRLKYWLEINTFLIDNNIDPFTTYTLNSNDTKITFKINGFVFDENNTLYCNEEMFKEIYCNYEFLYPWIYEYRVIINYYLNTFISNSINTEDRLSAWNYIYEYLSNNELIDSIFNNKGMIQNYKDSDYINIVGFYLDNEDCLVLGVDLFNKYNDSTTRIGEKTNYVIDYTAKISGAFILNNNKNNITNLFNDYYKNNTDDSILIINYETMDTLAMIESTINTLKNVFLWAGIIIAIFATLLLFNFISMSITNKKKEIGILRAVGARGLDVFKIFFIESILIVLICFILSIIGNFILCNVINSEMGAGLNGIRLLVFGPKSIILILIISLFVSFISTFLPVYTIAKKKPVDSIRAL